MKRYNANIRSNEVVVMRLELNIPDSALTAQRKSRVKAFARRLETHPEIIDELPMGDEKRIRVTDEDFETVREKFPVLGFLDDASDETVDEIRESIDTFKQEEFPRRV